MSASVRRESLSADSYVMHQRGPMANQPMPSIEILMAILTRGDMGTLSGIQDYL